MIKQDQQQEEILRGLLNSLALLKDYHCPNCEVYGFLDSVAKAAVSNLFGENTSQKADLSYLGKIDFPYFSMGAINSTHLFGLDELIIFSFYWSNRNRYKKVADLGANIGLHSVVMSHLGYQVTAYEPDPVHLSQLKDNVKRNCLENIPVLINKAVSVESGELEFIRVVGNTTGSHLSGAKENPYGELNKFIVEVDSFKTICDTFDFLKIDVEGHEADILLSTTEENWQNTDAIVEIGSPSNAQKVFEYFSSAGINLFSQKTGWNQVSSLEDMPLSYKDGSLFISVKDAMPW
ncbi:MAG: FkbM family methyltransferase [Synechococcales cyanobacterium]